MVEVSPLVVEVGTEELPVQDQVLAREHLDSRFRTRLDAIGWSDIEFAIWTTPLRIVLYAPAFPLREPDREERIKGPPARVAFDKDRRPTRALEGFLRSHDLEPEQIQVEETERGPYIVAVRRVAGRAAREVLPEILTECFRSIPFPKRMRWPGSEQPFARPVRWIVALLGTEVIPWTFAGGAAGRETRIRTGEPRPRRLAVESAEDYRNQAARHGVILDPEARAERFRAEIDRVLREISAEAGHACTHPDDPELLRFWVHISERPRVTWGRFDARFLALPSPIVMTTMRHHQKYAPVQDEEGQLMSWFLTPVQTQAADLDAVRATHERVFTARLRDAEFFWSEDRKAGLAAYAERLGEITWLEQGGTLADKVVRLQDLPRLWEAMPEAPRWDVASGAWEQVTRLFKADLNSHIVGEFPELEGELGALLAAEEGLPEAVAQAIRESVQPRTPDEPIPATPLGQALVFYDRLDSLLLSLGLGHRPSGSADPLGQRRWAGALLRILIEGRRYAALDAVAARMYEEIRRRHPRIAAWDEIEPALRELWTGRLRSYWQARGHRLEYIRSLLALRPFDPYDATRRLEALAQSDPEQVYRMGLVYKRLYHITEKHKTTDSPDPQRFREPMERTLYENIQDMAAAIEQAYQARDYSEVVAIYARLSPVLHRYFETVFVMTDDPALRRNRLNTLCLARRLFDRFGDLTQWSIEVKETY